MFTSIQLAFAGLGHYVLHWGIWGGLAAGLVALALFSSAIPVVGPYLTALRKDLLWAAFGCVLIMYGMFQGGRDAEARCVAKQKVVVMRVDKVVQRTKTPKYRAKHDRYSNSRY